MSDEELKAAIDSLVKEEQPLSVAPLIAEAKRRAAQAKDTKWMLDIIKKDVKVNARRLSREASAEQLIRKYRDDAWTPLRQIISAECYLIGFNVADARDALSAPAELRRFKAADVDDEASIADMNLLDYVCASFALNNKYEAISINTQPRNKAQLDRKGQLPVVQGPRYGNGTQEKVYFQPSKGSSYRLGSP